MKKILVLISLVFTAIISNAQCVSTFAGHKNIMFSDGTGTAARFSYPQGLAFDSAGNIYIADRGNNRIRKITSVGVVTTFAGSGASGFANGTAITAEFMSPSGVAIDGSGNIYVADVNNNRIRKITSAGIVSTLAGAGVPGFTDGIGATSRFSFPKGVAVDGVGNIYVADTNNNRIRKITSAGVVTTLAGSGSSGFADGTGISAQFNSPNGVAVDASGNVYVSDGNNNRIRKITPSAVVTTLAGSGIAGFADGTGSIAKFYSPNGVAVDGSGNVYVSDYINNKIRKITTAGLVSTLAGSGSSGFADGTGISAHFHLLQGLAVNSSGDVYVGEFNKIRKITPSGVVTTIAGYGSPGYADGTGTNALFYSPKGVATDIVGNVYVADSNNNRIRKITAAGIVTTLAGSGSSGFADGTGTSAVFNYPEGVAADASGNVYVADRKNNIIRKITPTGLVTTLAGSLVSGFADGTGTTAMFNYPAGLALDASNNVYVADRNNHRIRKISANGVVTTIAGSGTSGYADGIGTAALFSYPRKIAVDAAGNVYVSDTSNNRIRKITAAGLVTTLAGSGVSGYADGIGTSAQFYAPIGIAVDNTGNVYVGDENNSRIRKISAAGEVTTLAGSGARGYTEGYGASAEFFDTSGLAIDSFGNIYVGDTNNNTIRKIAPSLLTAIINYSSSSFCKSLSLAQAVILTGTGSYTGGIYSSTTGLTINATTGAITPSTSSPGTYTVTYTTPTSNICYITSTTIITINAVPTVSINYTGSPFCKSLTTAQPVILTGTGAYTSGTYSSSPSGLSINTATGAINPSTSNPGTYTITYSTVASGGCSAVIATTQITITNLSASINYSSTPFCQSNTSPQNVTLTGAGAYTGGIYSSTSGLTINSSTGAIIPSTSTLGTYTVSYITPSSNSCQITATTQVSINALPTANISYAGTPFCKTLTTLQPVTLTGTGSYTGGAFTAPAGLSISVATGAINPSLSTAGTYTVTYITPASSGCQITRTTQITINALPTANISYAGNPFCQSLNQRQVTLTGTGVYGGGVYSSSVGLNINSSTGAIIPSTSTPGNYTVSYATQTWGGCTSFTVTTPLTITTLPTATISYSGNPFCKSLTSVQVTRIGTGAFTGGSYTSTTGLSINAATGIINPSLSTAGTYTVFYTIPASGGCLEVITTTSVIILPSPTVSISADGVVATNTTINSGNVVQLQLNGSLGTPSNIQWSPAVAISSTSISNPLVYPSTTTTYTASFVNNNGCTQTTSFTVNVTPQPNIGTISLSSSNTGTIGLFDTITVNVQLTNATDLYSLYMKLKGNAAVSQYLDYSTYTAGNLLGTSNVISTPPTVTNGVPDFGMTKVGAAPGYSGTGLFYTFKFVPKNISIPDGTVFCFYLDDVNTYNSTATTCGLTNQGQICFTFSNQIKVWPGDLNNSNVVTTADLLPIGYFYNSTGPVRPNATIQWNAQPATLWGFNRSTMSGSAYKTFADSNGDGVINNADQAAIGFNMNQVHTRQANRKPFGIAPNTSNNAQVQGALNVTPNVSIINGAVLPQTVTFTVNLTNTGGLSSLYGISVNLIFDNTIFDLSTATINYTGSIFGNVGTDCLAMNYNSASGVSVGLTRYANAAINGQGLLFKVTLQTRTTLPNLTQTEVISYVDSANNQLGNPLEIGDSTPINFSVINVNLSLNDIVLNTFKLYPNPSKGILYFSVGDSYLDFQELKLKIVNTLGQVIDQISVKSATEEIITKNWGGSGMYFVQIETTQGEILGVKKIILQ
ncbi:T9SS type A sorting domain-containing protein [Flavobacterium sp.]|jgi:sugar lactone lactonase YvrE|uniref:T9SS type A sorting domain-containing protein n=1 Tax=Flavobacterium sp. TaxID=239 RepID=UPI0037BF5D3D